jgi:hypothetical protein
MLFERIDYSCPSEKHLLSFKPFIILFLAQVLFHEEVLISLQFRKDPHIIFWFDKDKHYIQSRVRYQMKRIYFFITYLLLLCDNTPWFISSYIKFLGIFTILQQTRNCGHFICCLFILDYDNLNKCCFRRSCLVEFLIVAVAGNVK